MKEQGIQTKIIKHLDTNGHKVSKTLVMNRAGLPDIYSCSPNGLLWVIEVKTPTGVLSKLQEYHLRMFAHQGAVAFACYGYEDYLIKYKQGTVFEADRLKSFAGQLPFIHV